MKKLTFRPYNFLILSLFFSVLALLMEGCAHSPSPSSSSTQWRPLSSTEAQEQMQELLQRLSGFCFSSQGRGRMQVQEGKSAFSYQSLYGPGKFWELAVSVPLRGEENLKLEWPSPQGKSYKVSGSLWEKWRQQWNSSEETAPQVAAFFAGMRDFFQFYEASSSSDQRKKSIRNCRVYKALAASAANTTTVLGVCEQKWPLWQKTPGGIALYFPASNYGLLLQAWEGEAGAAVVGEGMEKYFQKISLSLLTDKKLALAAGGEEFAEFFAQGEKHLVKAGDESLPSPLQLEWKVATCER